MAETWFGQYPEPSTTQLAGFTAFEISKVVIYPVVTGSATDTFANTIGMYTSHVTETDYHYMLWLEYEPWFDIDGNVDKVGSDGNAQTNASADSWCNFSLKQFNQTWRLLFQMGDEYSDWEGLEYTFTEGSPVGVGEANRVALSGVKVSHARLFQTITYSDSDVTGFVGYASKGSRGGDGKSADRCVINVNRVTLDTEKDSKDGKVVRVAAGRSLKGMAWTN